MPGRVGLLFILMLVAVCAPDRLGAERALAVFDFATTDAARAAWSPQAGSPAVALFEGTDAGEPRGVRFPCPAAQAGTRWYWDRTIAEDFSDETLFTLRVHIADPAPVSSLTLYFRSGAGWFSTTWGNLGRGWQELRGARANFSTSGTPTGWHAIDGIRFSPWKSSVISGDTEIVATELRVSNPQILVVRGTKSTAPATADSTTVLVGQCLDAWGIDHGVISEEDVETGGLAGARLAIFPYSNNMSAAEIARVQEFVAGGGRIIVFFTAPAAVFTLLGLTNQGSAGVAPRAMRFNTGIVDCVPPVARQASWNCFRVVPASPDVRVLAEWQDADGNALGLPAWTVGPNGAYMSHILLSDDLDNKKALMLALAAHFVPNVADAVARRALDGIGRVGDYVDFAEAVAGIDEIARAVSRRTQVEQALAEAVRLRELAVDSLETGSLCEQLDAIASTRVHLREAFYLAQEPREPEFRAVWASFNDTSGPFVEGWDRMAADLADARFHAVMPYMATGGLAHYASDLLPRSASVNARGDHIAACIAACRPRGIQTHVRKLNWFMLGAPSDFVSAMRAAGRTQVDVDGAPVDWLCPSHPLNFELERQAMLEIVDNYEVDGIHYDFIRYPDERSCYCDGCRERFQQDSGLAIVNWPADCFSGVHKEAYRAWRREQITRLVRAMREAIDARDRNIRISAAVFSNYPDCRTTVGQDWVSWIKNGYLDFVCPMNYRGTTAAFKAVTESQLGHVAGRVPLYPGVGVASSQSNLSPDHTIAQLRAARELETGGYVLFVYNDYLSGEVLPALRKGFTAGPGPSWLAVR
ncbi:MAG: family 10 glycosylhydrolase [Candidatus Sumerlaeia bacterium]|nr:family 10 glycosylhydrolase [Candidatus Sumerlaeia bacterium]